MLDQILGRPSPTIRRSQIFLVLFFWLWRLYKGDGAVQIPSQSRILTGTTSAYRPLPSGGRFRTADLRKRRSWFFRIWVALVGRRAVGFVENLNEKLKHFTPYQLILGTLTVTYALRHIGDLFGLGIPEPLASLYTRSYYRATYVNTALDAGFATAMAIRPKWLKDLCSVLFGVYYLIWASEGDEVLRKFRALCTVEMLRVTWEKTNNPYIRLVTRWHRPPLAVVKHVLIPRPSTSSRSMLPAVKAMLFFNGTEDELAKATQLVVDFPGGGFIAMGPECHEERLRRWAKRTGKPVLGVNYGKAPEYPYPWAIEEGFDAYRTLMETRGTIIGIKSGKLDVVLTGDSAGGNICATIMLRILEHPTGIPRPISMIFAYPALDFNFTSWMSPSNLRVLRTEQSDSNIPGIMHGKDHMRHKAPLSVVDDVQGKSKRTRQQSWGQTIGAKLPALTMSPRAERPGSGSRPQSPINTWTNSLPRTMSTKIAGWLAPSEDHIQADDSQETDEVASTSDGETSSDDEKTVKDYRPEADRSLRDRVKTPKAEREFDLPPLKISEETKQVPVVPGVEVEQAGEVTNRKKKKKAPIGTRLTMTSRVGYFQDRIITPSMMRAMAILYIGPRRNPDFKTDYYISPILSPPHLLAHFPPVYLICGERDPFVDDTIIFAGKIREAKRARRAAAEIAAQGKSVRYGESLRMSNSASTSDSSAGPDHILRETDDDWVQMRIIEGWGHGFMQMTSLMREVDSVLIEMADWIDESFERHSAIARDQKEVLDVRKAANRYQSQVPEVILSPEEHIPPPVSTLVKPVRSYKSPTSKHLGGADLGGFLEESDVTDEDEGKITFTPKSKNKRNPPPSKFTPVPRRSSKDALNLHRSESAPKFDIDETGSSGEAMIVKTPPLSSRALPLDGPKGSGAFAFFNPSRTAAGTPGSSKTATPKGSGTPGASLFGPRRTSGGAAGSPGGTTSSGGASVSGSNASSASSKPTNSLVAAAVAGARAASPALAAAGLVPQSVENVSEAELMRRRRLEAVFGMGETDSADVSEDEGSEPE